MAMGHCFGYTDELPQADLSPVSALRLNFDTLTPETTDIMPDSRTVFGLAVPKFVPQRFMSWMGQETAPQENENLGGGDNNDATAEHSNAINDNKINVFTKKVCFE